MRCGGQQKKDREIAERLKTEIKASVGGVERVKKAESDGEAQTEVTAGERQESPLKTPMTSGPV